MGSLSSSKLPVIHISPETLKPGTGSWLSTSKDVLQAMEEYGCFIAVYDELPLQLYNSMFSSLSQLFDLPSETKKNTLSELFPFGFLSKQVYSFFADIYESTTFPANPEGIQKFAKTLWPNGNDQFCETSVSYSKLLQELEQMVMGMVFERYGIKDYNSHKELTTYTIRMNKYRTPVKDESKVGIEIHTDKNFITILQHNQVSGLEVETKDGEWIPVDFLPSSFIVMAGNAMLAWSNDRIHAAAHRVMMNENKIRYSVGLFSHRKGMIEVPEELIDDEHPPRYKPFDNFEYLRFLKSYSFDGKHNAIKAYWGI